ncbi:hypothetical protein DFJ73DRAFT_632984, partial [Zopfochytrium polystomum]
MPVAVTPPFHPSDHPKRCSLPLSVFVIFSPNRDYLRPAIPHPSSENKPNLAIPIKVVCPFYAKVAACRFGRTCSRAHLPASPTSNVILLPAMYIDAQLHPVSAADAQHDESLDGPDEAALTARYHDFFADALPEFEAQGRVIQFKTCRNFCQHLRGNVYVQYATAAEAERAVSLFHGRFFERRQLSCWRVDVPTWRGAICGNRRRCPKGDEGCNFLHV